MMTVTVGDDDDDATLTMMGQQNMEHIGTEN